jgi:hypothetical protein
MTSHEKTTMLSWQHNISNLVESRYPNISRVVMSRDNPQKTTPLKTCDFIKYHNLPQSCD